MNENDRDARIIKGVQPYQTIPYPVIEAKAKDLFQQSNPSSSWAAAEDRVRAVYFSEAADELVRAANPSPSARHTEGS